MSTPVNSNLVLVKPRTAYTLSGLFTGDTPALYAARYDISGLAGAQFRFCLTAGTSISTLPVWALAG